MTSLIRPPLSTVIAVNSRRPPINMIARCRDTVSTPAACSSAVSLRVWIIVMNDSVTSRWSRRAAIPSAGTSRIQLSITAGRDSALAIQGLDGLPDLYRPRCGRVDGGGDGLDGLPVRLGEQRDQAGFPIGEVFVERAAGGPGPANDVGDGGGRVADVVDRVGQRVDEPPARVASRFVAAAVDFTVVHPNFRLVDRCYCGPGH